VHPPQQLLKQRTITKRRHPDARDEITPGELSEHARVDLG
jgi:hypothetical protein